VVAAVFFDFVFLLEVAVVDVAAGAAAGLAAGVAAVLSSHSFTPSCPLQAPLCEVPE
jgi:hypothetical protein